MIRVCDAIMGTGKSSAAITYLNEHPDDKFIYITPYLDEAERIKKNCPSLHFVEPSDKIAKYEFKKCVHTAALVEEGRNIATTHQSFKNYSAETLEHIRSMGYTLIIDENVDILERFEFHQDDLKLTVDAGYVKEENNTYSLVNSDYKGRAHAEMFRLLKTRSLVKITDEKENDTLFYWTLPPDLLTAFKDVFILTYLFEGQSLRYFMEIYGIPYTYIGIEKTSDGRYRFGDYPGYVPEYVNRLGDMIEILDNDYLNEIGEDYHSLSKRWFGKDSSDLEQLKKNLFNCYYKIWDTGSDERLWGTFKSSFDKIKGKGYTNNFLSFNTKATNKYRDKKYLAYVVNVFMNVEDKAFYNMHGIEVDEDAYATSIMVQWIWRSAIRDGEKIYLYIPSKRMRRLLNLWIENASKGGKNIE